ncbi:MAG TPA: amidase [Gemmatimonadales bacterium]|nr:amidase [Gemmatimonadales bacterium]
MDRDLRTSVHDSVSRREFLAVASLGVASAIPGGRDPSHKLRLFSTQPSRHGHFDGLSLRELRTGLDDGRWTARSLVEACLTRIHDLDRHGPELRHILETNPQALEIADRLDGELRGGQRRGALHGIPILLKDNVDTADQMSTSAGSLALAGSRAPSDAFLAERLRSGGAILLAKTSMSEWANFRSPRSSSGWCSRGGQGKNPYVLDRTPCGSSSGTAGGVAAGYAPAGIGTETDGSITCPASVTGLVGLKPTVGLVSRSGIIPISSSQDTAGPLCTSVEDAAILLSAIVGADPRDPSTAAIRVGPGVDYTRFLNPNALSGKRLGVPRKVFSGYNDETDRLFGEALDVLRRLGATLIDPADLPHADDNGDAETVVLQYEFKAGLNAYLAALGPEAPVSTLADVIAFNERERARVMPFFGQETFIKAEARGPLTDLAYRRAKARCLKLWRTEGIDAVISKHRLDALVAPTGNPAWPIDLVNGDHFTGSVTTPAAVAGYPHITVPAGFAFGLPVGLSFFGSAWSEPLIIGLAFAFEQATRHRRPPSFLTTADTGQATAGAMGGSP